MPIYWFPENIRIDIGLDAPTRTLIERLLDHKDENAKLAEGADKLDASTKGLQKIVDEHQPPK